ncbi:hypothetical protein MMC06_005270 [Schaereria dolodes]|nr:hypothetical protein [Schaereria dolodes]
MPISALPIEILLETLYSLSPNDIANLQLTSSTFYHIIQHHEDNICQKIARSLDLKPNKFFTVQGSCLQGLRILWQRHQWNDALISRLEPQHEVTSGGLDFLWTYCDAQSLDIQNPTANGYRQLMQMMSIDDLDSLIATARGCAHFLAIIIQSASIEGKATLVDRGSMEIRYTPSMYNGLLEIVLKRGLHHVAQSIAEQADRVSIMSEDLKAWQQHERTGRMAKLREERRWKSKKARLLENAVDTYL